jgi:MscS family membrane protein
MASQAMLWFFLTVARKRTALGRLVLLVGLLGPAFGQAQPAAKQGTPREALETHLNFLRPEYQNNRAQRRTYTGLAAKVFDNPDLPEDLRNDRRRRAQMLKEIYEGLGKYIDLEQVPDDPNYRDTTYSYGNVYLVATHLGYDITLEKVAGRWYYSKETVENIPVLYGAVFIIDTQQLFGINLFDPPETFLHITAWQYAGLAALGLSLFLAFKLLGWLLVSLPCRWMRHRGRSQAAQDLYDLLARPLVLFMLLAAARLLLPALQLPIQITRYLYPFLYVLLVWQLTRAAYHLINLVGNYFVASSGRWALPVDPQLGVLIKRVLRILVVMAGAIYLMQYLGVNVAGVIAGLSIGGIAIALAAQDTLKNFFGSLMIFLDRPFKVGDWIIGDKLEGEVENIGFRSTQIRTFANSLTTVPNGRLADMTIDNMGARSYHRFLTTIAIAYHTPPDLIEAFIEGLREIVRRQSQVRQDNWQIALYNFGESAWQIRYSAYIITNDVQEEINIREGLIMRNLRLAEHLGVALAYPTTTLHVASLPGQPPVAPPPAARRDYLDKMRAFLDQDLAKGFEDD